MAESCSCRAAIVELHDFFAAWYRGDTGADIDLMEAALTDEFRLITPKATVVSRAEILKATRDQRGAYPSARIEIEPVLCSRVRGLHVSTYEEWQYDDEERPARLSTAVLSTTDGRWKWHVVHETWLGQGDTAQ